jgi:hypothetical protein
LVSRWGEVVTKAEKSRSPFYPGQPVPVELFVGRAAQIERIRTRGVQQVARGKPATFFVQGEYGIGKSSIAGYVLRLAERQHGLLRIYANLGGADDLTGMAGAILEATVRSGAFNPTTAEKIRNWLSKYIGRQELFGLSLNLDTLRQDAPNLATPFQMLNFLSEGLHRLKDAKVKGVFLVLDEINGIAANPQFAHFIKGLVEQNAMADHPMPLLLMLCGVEERRRQMIENHPPVDRIFEIVDIEAMSEHEMKDFFSRSFSSVHMSVEPEAMGILTRYSAGLPKIMHLVGDVAYWLDEDAVLTKGEAFRAVVEAAEEVGKKYVDQQIYKALRSADYHSILDKIAKMGPDRMSFTRQEVAAGLTDSEKKKLGNFLQKMKRLNGIRSGEVQGEYVFCVRMVRFYIWLQSVVKTGSQKP